MLPTNANIIICRFNVCIPPVSVAVWFDTCAGNGLRAHRGLFRSPKPAIRTARIGVEADAGPFYTFVLNEFTLHLQCTHRFHTQEKLFFPARLHLNGCSNRVRLKGVKQAEDMKALQTVTLVNRPGLEN